MGWLLGNSDRNTPYAELPVLDNALFNSQNCDGRCKLVTHAHGRCSERIKRRADLYRERERETENTYCIAYTYVMDENTHNKVSSDTNYLSVR